MKQKIEFETYENIWWELWKVIKYISYQFVSQWKQYLTVDDFKIISNELWIKELTLRQIYQNQRYRKAIEQSIQKLRNELNIWHKKEKDEFIEVDNENLLIKDEYYVDIENSYQLNFRTWKIEIHLSDKLFSLYDLLNEERLFLLQYQRKWKNSWFETFIENRIHEIKKIRKKINYILVSVTKD
jgi:hypothetical protein